MNDVAVEMVLPEIGEEVRIHTEVTPKYSPPEVYGELVEGIEEDVERESVPGGCVVSRWEAVEESEATHVRSYISWLSYPVDTKLKEVGPHAPVTWLMKEVHWVGGGVGLVIFSIRVNH